MYPEITCTSYTLTGQSDPYNVGMACFELIHPGLMQVVHVMSFMVSVVVQKVKALSPGLATTISKITYPLLPSCKMTEITLKLHTSSIQPNKIFDGF